MSTDGQGNFWEKALAKVGGMHAYYIYWELSNTTYSPYSFEKPEVIHHREGTSYRYWLYNNGILSEKESVKKALEKISNYNEKRNYSTSFDKIDALFEPSNGFLNDIIRTNLNKLSLKTRGVRSLLDYSLEKTRKGMSGCYIFHSGGTSTGKNMLRHLGPVFEKRFRELNSIVGCGSASFFSQNDGKNVLNIINKNDPIPLLSSPIQFLTNRLSYGKIGNKPIHTIPGNTLFPMDHGFIETYLDESIKFHELTIK